MINEDETKKMHYKVASCGVVYSTNDEMRHRSAWGLMAHLHFDTHNSAPWAFNL